ncbi:MULTISPECIES: ketopantoate reductase family protein [Paenibacillus]|uniref:2-dehydropantoate 2-reductase n=1 Tax=Paenibacillus brasilensis TaxID=128574 RepID=A0ABU0KWV4_9BACL|nr:MULTISPECIES: 2-dehydropantoate 2-reductase [Paenibacillus]MDQ0493075.1 2-dehydropantoate 2-reductase [Paenibacillus brasilensis]
MIDIIGAGSLGLLFAGRLASSGTEVRLWTRTLEQARMIACEGITVFDKKGRTAVHVPGDRLQVAPLADWQRLNSHTAVQWILLMTKQGGVDEVLKQILPVAKTERATGIVCLQNGIGHIERIRRAWPEAVLYPAVTTEGAKRQGAASVVHAGAGITEIGWPEEQEKAQDRNFKQYVLNRLLAAGFDVCLSKEIENGMYRKLLINAVINPLTAIWRIRNGELLSDPVRLHMMRKLYDEGIQVYEAHGIHWESGWWDQIMNVCQATAENHSSMLADVLAQSMTEVASINGQLVQMAELAGVTAPTHEVLWQLIEGMRLKEE